MSGRSALILKAVRQPDLLAPLLQEEGFTTTTLSAVDSQPLSDFATIDQTLGRPGDFEWIVFTSVDAVNHLLGHVRATQREGAQLPGRVGAIGPATQRALSVMGFDSVWVPSTFTASGLARELPAKGRVIVARSDTSPSRMDQLLAERGIDVVSLPSYRTVNVEPAKLSAALENSPDVIAVMRPSCARALVSAAGSEKIQSPIASITPATTEAFEDGGMRAAIEAEPHTSQGVAACIVAHFGNTPASV